MLTSPTATLWFDVGIKRYTTLLRAKPYEAALWFDVGIKRYTTAHRDYTHVRKLWFDVGIKRYTTLIWINPLSKCCGLM